jgi:hypothetical protein
MAAARNARTSGASIGDGTVGLRRAAVYASSRTSSITRAAQMRLKLAYSVSSECVVAESTRLRPHMKRIKLYTATTAMKFVQDGESQTVTAHTNGVTQCNCSTVDVHDFIRDAKFAHRCNSHCSECFVQFEQVNIGHLHADAIECAQDGAAWLVQQRCVVGAGNHSVRNNFSEWLYAARFRCLL